jgi:MFS family permease
MPERAQTITISDRSVILGMAVLFALVAIEAGLFYVFPQNGYYYGMLYAGILALGLAVALYLAGSIASSGMFRLAFAGSFCFGVVMLLAADLATPNSAFDIDKVGESSTVARIPLLVFTLVIIGVGIAATLWRPFTRKEAEGESEEAGEGTEDDGTEELDAPNETTASKE